MTGPAVVKEWIYLDWPPRSGLNPEFWVADADGVWVNGVEAVKIYNALVAHNKATVAALRKFGAHKIDCVGARPGMKKPGISWESLCTCGFSDALKAAGG